MSGKRAFVELLKQEGIEIFLAIRVLPNCR